MSKIVVLTLLVLLATVQAAPPEPSSEKPKDYTGFADFFRSLKCGIDGGTTFEWFHNGTKIQQTSSKFFLFNDIIIAAESPVTDSYQGTYQCKASNQDGTLLGPKIKVFFTIVGRFIKTDQQMEEKDVTVGKDLALTCPPRTQSRNVFYHWGGQQGVTGAWFIPQAPHYMIMNDGTLLFANVREQDLEYFNVLKSGVSCSIESKGAQKRLAFSQRFLLREVGARNTQPFGPTIKTEIEDQEVAKGTKFVIFRCGAVGLPTPSYSWTFTGFNGIEVSIVSGHNGYELEDFNHVLIITTVQTKHDGWYKCKVNSSYSGQDHVDEKSARLHVKGKPQWTPHGELKDSTLREGDDFQWTCQAYGNPDPSYTWLKDGEKLLPSDKYEINGGVIKLKAVSMSEHGVYQCLAENDFGSISTSGSLTVIPAPTTPAPVSCRVTKMNLMFLVDGSGSVPKATFNEFKKFMTLLVAKFDISPTTTHVGVLQYSSKPRTGLEFYFTEHQTLDSVQDAISKVVYHYGAYTFGGYAMNLAQKIMNHYDRTDAKNVWVLLMDDGLWDKKLARKISKSIRQAGTKVIVLDTSNIMHDIADRGLDFASENLEENVETVAEEICK